MARAVLLRGFALAVAEALAEVMNGLLGPPSRLVGRLHPQLAPVLSALDELPEAQVRTALTRLSAGATGRELAESVSKVGASALRMEIKHPGVGGALVRMLGDDGAELAAKLNADQALTVAQHADDLAKLPASQRQSVLAISSGQFRGIAHWRHFRGIDRRYN